MNIDSALRVCVSDGGNVVMINGLSFRKADSVLMVVKAAKSRGWKVDIFSGESGFISCLASEMNSPYSVSFGGRNGIVEFITINDDRLIPSGNPIDDKRLLTEFMEISDRLRNSGTKFPVSARVNYRTLYPELKIL